LPQHESLVLVACNRYPVPGDAEARVPVIEDVIVANDDAFLEVTGANAVVAREDQQFLVDVDATGFAVIENERVAALG